jgi:citrate lyase beta subunit
MKLFTLAALVAQVGCSAGADTADTADGVALTELEAAEASILAAIGAATCASEEDCRTVAFGDKPCGGPWEYLAYCAATVDEAALLAEIDAYNAMEAKYNAENGLASTCAVTEDPGPAWVDGACALAPMD